MTLVSVTAYTWRQYWFSPVKGGHVESRINGDVSVQLQRLKSTRLKNSLSQSELAIVLGVSDSTIGDWENGRYKLGLHPADIAYTIGDC